MEKKHNPASDPMNGPNRLMLDRTPEAREYDARDWPGSNSFQPPHLRRLFASLVETETIEPEGDTQIIEEE